MRPVIVGYTADQQTKCVPCCVEQHVPASFLDDPAMFVEDNRGGRITPIFSTFEYPDALECDSCGAGLSVVVVPWCSPCGTHHHGTRHTQRSMTRRTPRMRDLVTA